MTREVIADTADRRVEILLETDAAHATRTRLGPRSAGTDPHVHRHHNDVFYVLEGELTLRLGPGDGEVTAMPGMLVVVPPLVVHGYRNASDAGRRVPQRPRARQRLRGVPARAARWRAALVRPAPAEPADGGRPATDATVVRLEADGEDRPAGNAGEALAMVQAALPSLPAEPGRSLSPKADS